VNEGHKKDHQYGYLSIVLDYPSREDRLNMVRAQCGSPCVNPGGEIAIHGGYFGPTNGCIRILDQNPAHGIHSRSIAQLGEVIRAAPNERVPVLSVPVASPGCHPEIGRTVSQGCATALIKLLDADASDRPARSLVIKWLANAADYTPQERQTGASAVASGAPALPMVTTPPLGQGLHTVSVEAVWATSEAPICGPARDQPCRAAHLIDGDPQTVWCESVLGTGEGEWIAFSWRQPRRIVRIDLRNGNWQGNRYSADWSNNGRVTEVEIALGGRTVRCRRDEADPSEISCDLSGMKVNLVSLRVAKAVRGELSDHTCISDVTIYSNDT
jgi:hypothetical protein